MYLFIPIYEFTWNFLVMHGPPPFGLYKIVFSKETDSRGRTVAEG